VVRCNATLRCSRSRRDLGERRELDQGRALFSGRHITSKPGGCGGMFLYTRMMRTSISEQSRRGLRSKLILRDLDTAFAVLPAARGTTRGTGDQVEGLAYKAGCRCTGRLRRRIDDLRRCGQQRVRPGNELRSSAVPRRTTLKGAIMRSFKFCLPIAFLAVSMLQVPTAAHSGRSSMRRHRAVDQEVQTTAQQLATAKLSCCRLSKRCKP